MNTPTRQALEHINRRCGIAGTHPYFRSRRLLAEQVTRMLAEGMTFDPSSADWAAFGEGATRGHRKLVRTVIAVTRTLEERKLL